MLLKLMIRGGLLAMCAVLLVVVLTIACLSQILMVNTYGTQTSYDPGQAATIGIYGKDNDITLMARNMAAHLEDCRPIPNHDPYCAGYGIIAPGFPAAILAWGHQHCPGCAAWSPDTFQCVTFVLGAYALYHELPFDGNAWTWWATYGTPAARALGYQEIRAANGGLPRSPGDILVVTGDPGHVAIVLGWEAPHDGQPGLLTVAQANADKPIQNLVIYPNYTLQQGYLPGMQPWGYIHPTFLDRNSPT